MIILSSIFYLGIFPKATPITTTHKVPIPNSISLLEEVNLNGSKQWISIRGVNKDLPLLLWIHGGPAFPQMPFAHYVDKELIKKFIIVHWDQRGSGKSYHALHQDDFVYKDLIKQDALELIFYLRNKLGKEKIFLLAHSWGTRIGIELASQYPEYFHAYIGVGQLISLKTAVEISQKWLMQEMHQKNNQKDLFKLSQLERPHYFYRDYRQFYQWIVKYGGSNDWSKSRIVLTLFKSPEYCFRDYIKLYRGFKRAGNYIHNAGAMEQYNYLNTISSFEIPVYFVIGTHDYIAPYELVEEFFIKIKAPIKKLIVFENTSHMPFFADLDKFTMEISKLTQYQLP